MGKGMRHIYQKLLFYYYYKAQRLHVKSRPLKVWVEPTNACNLECKICPQSLGGFPKTGLMDIELIKKIALELRDINPLLVTLHLSGEPLIHPQIAQFVKILKQEGLDVTFSTNGLLLTKSKIEELIEAGLDDIRIDFAFNKQRYEEIRQKAVWDVVYNNILSLLEIKKQRNLFKPRILIMNIDVTDNREDTTNNLNNLKRLFMGYPAEISNLNLHTWAGEFADMARDATPLLKKISDKGKYFPCPHIFGSFVITWDGDVVPCCRDLKKDYVIGNIKEHSIMELWNSERLISLREKQVLKQFRDIPLCRECTLLWNNYNSLFKLAKASFRSIYIKFRH